VPDDLRKGRACQLFFSPDDLLSRWMDSDLNPRFFFWHSQ
jgi:hypothetical protein